MNNTGENFGESFRTSQFEQMRCYDMLPASVRRVLQDAVENWASPPIYERIAHPRSRWGKRRDPMARMNAEIEAIRASDRKELLYNAEQRRRAGGPYRGNVPDRGWYDSRVECRP